jgi:hypothetical protein
VKARHVTLIIDQGDRPGVYMTWLFPDIEIDVDTSDPVRSTISVNGSWTGHSNAAPGRFVIVDREDETHVELVQRADYLADQLVTIVQQVVADTGHDSDQARAAVRDWITEELAK